MKFVETGKPGRGVNLEDKGIVVAVEDEAGEAVVFAVDDSVAGGFGTEVSFGDRFGEAFLPEGGVDGSWFAGVDDSDADGGVGIVETDGEEFVVAIEDDGEFAGFGGAVLVFDAVAEDPGMAGANEGFGGGAEAKAEAFWGRVHGAEGRGWESGAQRADSKTWRKF